MANEIIKTAQTAITESAIDVFITPALKKLRSVYKKKFNEYLVPKGRHFKKYLDEAYDEYSTIKTLLFHERVKSLKDIYLPLTLIPEDIESKEEPVRIEGIPVDLIKRCRKILIKDTAGMGKSTMLKRMFLDVNDIGLNEVGIPLFVDLRRLKSDWSIIDEIEKRLSTLSETFDKELLLYLLEIGGFIFFLDGYDEISLNDKNTVTQNLQDFINSASKNYYILTSRQEPALKGFSGFYIYNIRSLEEKEAYALFEKYDTQDKEVSNKLISLLKTNDYKSAKEFLKSPLLTILLFNAFDFKETIPLKKHLFYRQVYDAYFEHHDLKKGDYYIHDKSSGLDIDDFGRVLKYIGFHSLKEGIEYSKDELLVILDKAKLFFSNLSFKSSDFLKDILTAVPLFCEENAGYKWAHKSLMEYFAARFIADEAKDKQDRLLSLIYKSEDIEKYINMLDLYYDIDYKGFNKNIRYQLCKDYVSFFDSINYESKIIPKELISERIAKLFWCKPVIIELGDNAYPVFIKSIDKDFRNNDFFNKYFKNYENINNGYKYNGFLYNSFKIVLGYFTSSYVELIGLLYSRSEDLFKKAGFISNSDIKRIMNKKMVKDKLYRIDVNTGGSSKEFFLMFNSLIVFPPTKHRIRNYYLDYNACKEVVDSFEKSSNSDAISQDLFDGL